MISDHLFNDIPTENLDALVTENDLSVLAREIVFKDQEAHIFGLTSQKREEICRGCTSWKKIPKPLIMIKWKMNKATDYATYRNLFTDACKCQQVKVAKKVRELLLKTVSFENEAVKMFREDIIEIYKTKAHPSSDQWPYFNHKCYVSQALYKCKESKVTKPIKLDEIFDGHTQSDSSKKVFIIEGVAGSGKTTLIWHICKQWALGELYKQFSLMIHIPLNSSALEEAKDLADFIPHFDHNMRGTVIAEIIRKKGKGVCFVFDGCDEVPICLWKKIDSIFLRNESGLSQSIFLLTSRPSARWNHIHQEKLLLKGCLTGDIFDKLLQDDKEKRERINRLLELNSNLCTLCDLPINAVILIFIHEKLNDDNMPVTRTDLFCLMLCNFIVRHLQTRTQHEETMIQDLESDLPPDIKHALTELCFLAFNASASSKKKMTYSELKKLGIGKPNENLGLLEITCERTVNGLESYYSFPHLSIQEFLAALYVKWMGNECTGDEDKEALAMKKILDEDPLNPILTFYAGLTKLKNQKILNLLKIKSSKYDRIEMLIHANKISNDTRRWILASLNCIYECQDEGLVKLFNPVDDKLLTEVLISTQPIATALDSSQLNRCLPFQYLTLYPSDCLSIGYYARLKSQNMKENTMLRLNLTDCCINGICIEALAGQMKKKLSFCKTPCISLVLSDPLNTRRAITSIRTLLTGPYNLLESLSLSFDCNNTPAILTSIIEGLDNSSPLSSLKIFNSNINSSHIHYLILLIFVKSHLTGLHIRDGDLREVIPLLSEAVRIRGKINRLGLCNCNVNDKGLDCLAITASEISPFLLDLKCNPLSGPGVVALMSKIGSSSHFDPIYQIHIDESLLDEKIKLFIDHINEKGIYLIVNDYFNYSDVRRYRSLMLWHEQKLDKLSLNKR